MLKIEKRYKWFVLTDITIKLNPDDKYCSYEQDITTLVEPKRETSAFNIEYLNPSHGFSTIEEAKLKLIEWNDKYNASYVLHIIYEVTN